MSSHGLSEEKEIIERGFFISALGFSDAFLEKHEVVKFISKDNLCDCKRGTFLVGSVERNRNHDNARCDNGELSLDILYSNPKGEKWEFHGDDCKRYTGLAATERTSSISGRAGWGISMPIVSGNPFSLSVSFLDKGLSESQRLEKIEQIRSSTDYKSDDVLLRFKKPRDLIFTLTEKLCSTTGEQLMTIGTKIIYKNRKVQFESLEDYKSFINETFWSDNLNVYPLFMKPEVYKNDEEYRVLWLAHSGEFNKFTWPAWLNYQSESHVILDGIDFDEHFEIIHP
jgi:hypothetical protein